MGLSLAVANNPHWPYDGVDALDVFSLALLPTAYCKFNEASGNLINYGSDGNSGAVSGATQGQTGQSGAKQAYLFDGVDDRVLFTNADVPATAALTTHRWYFLIKPASLGEGNVSSIAAWGDLTSILRFGTTNSMAGKVDMATTDALSITNNNQVDFLTEWTLIFIDYDDANVLGLGRRIRIMRATVGSATTILTLATNTAGTGAVVAATDNMALGNREDTGATIDGLLDRAFAGADLWSPNGAPADLTLPDQIRSIVFGV